MACLARPQNPVLRRSRDGLVDLDRIAATVDAGLHGIAGKAPGSDDDLYFCGHGPEVRDAKAHVGYLQRHRKAREHSILHRLSKSPADIPSIVRASYIGIDPRLVPAAGRSVFAHLEDLVTRKVVATDGEPDIGGVYRLVAPLA